MSSLLDSLTVSNLEVSYSNGSSVVADINFNVPASSVGVLLGMNGSGKTTILNTVAGLIKPKSGEVLLAGSPLSGDSVGYLFQDYRQTLLPWRSNLGNLRLPLELRHVPVSEAESQVRDLLSSSEVDLPLSKVADWIAGFASSDCRAFDSLFLVALASYSLS
ncbi:MAG: ATP-binding cassette domain-containing protein [Patescibacteria group bacterium]